MAVRCAEWMNVPADPKPRLVLVQLPGDLPASARELVRLVVRTLTAAHGVPVVLYLDGVDELTQEQAQVVQAWCLDDYPTTQEPPEIQLLQCTEAQSLIAQSLHLRPETPLPQAQQALQAVLTPAGAPPDAAEARPRLLAVVVADQTPVAVAHSLRAHVVALQAVTGYDVELVLVDQHPDPRVHDLLRLVDGAQILRPGHHVGVGPAWDDAWDRLPADLVLLSTATSVPEPAAVQLLVDALTRDPRAQAGLPGSSAPAAVLVRQDALRRLRDVHGHAFTASQHAVLAMTRLTRRLADARLATRIVPDARFGGLPLRQEATVLRPGWSGAVLSVAHPEAATIGPWTYFTGKTSSLVTFEPYERIQIGAYCSIADEVRLINPGRPDAPVTDRSGRRRSVPRRDAHRIDAPTTFPVGNRFPGLGAMVDSGAYVPGSGDVLSIGHDVWIGFGAYVLGSVSVGHGAVIGAGAVVTKDVPPYAVVAGNPARVVRYRVAEHLVRPMLDIAWWDWPEDLVMERASWFARPVEEFVEQFHLATSLWPCRTSSHTPP